MPCQDQSHPPSTTRRQLLLASGSLAAASLAPAATANTVYPKGPVKIIVPFAPGGATDVIARMLGERLSKSMGAPFLVDNKPGASGNIGTEQMVKSPADGLTLSLLLSGVVQTNPYIYTKVPFQVERDIAFVSKVANTSGVLSVHPSVPANNAQELMAYLKANPNKLSFGSYGQGSFPHLMCEYMRNALGASMNHVPYKGEAPAVQDLLGNQVQVTYASVNAQKQHIDLGKIRPIAAITTERISAMPKLPTMAEQGFKDEVFRMESWFGVIAPKGTPRAVQLQLSQAISKVMSAPDVQAMIVQMGYTPVADSTPDKLTAEYKQWAPRWKQLAEISGAKIDQ